MESGESMDSCIIIILFPHNISLVEAAGNWTKIYFVQVFIWKEKNSVQCLFSIFIFLQTYIHLNPFLNAQLYATEDTFLFVVVVCIEIHSNNTFQYPKSRFFPSILWVFTKHNNKITIQFQFNLFYEKLLSEKNIDT